jgi:hypothetical protein
MEKTDDLTIDFVVKKYITFFSKYGLTESKIRNGYNVWAKNGATLVKDYVWSLFQSLLLETAKQSNKEVELYRSQRDIYFEMLYFRRRYEKVKANELLQLFFDADLKKTFLETNLELRVKIISGHCCEYCDSLHQKIYEPLDVIKNKYLGSQKCTNPNGCNCTYSCVSLRDSKGRLIRKSV